MKKPSGTKSYVSMEQKQCIICGINYNTDAILLDRRLINSMEQNTITGLGFCPEHQRLRNDGYIALIEATTSVSGSRVKHENANRTGRICHVKTDAFDKIFNCEVPKDLGMVYVDLGVIDKIQEMVEVPND